MEEHISEIHDPLLVLYNFLQTLGDDSTPQSEKREALKGIIPVWEDFCRYHHLQAEAGRCTVENIKAALVLGENKLLQSGIIFGEEEKVKETVRLIIDGVEKKRHEKESETEDIFMISEDLQKYLQTEQGNTSYPPELLIQYINSDSIGKIHENILLKLIAHKTLGCEHIIGCIAPENILKIQGENGKVLMKGILAGYTNSIVKSITQENMYGIDWSFFRKLKDNNDTEHLDILLSYVSEKNSSEIHWSILDILGYGGPGAEFIRTFSPKAQKRWRKLEEKTRNIRLFIRNFFTQEN